jgi:putative ABC transport system substrate-binding protein
MTALERRGVEHQASAVRGGAVLAQGRRAWWVCAEPFHAPRSRIPAVTLIISLLLGLLAPPLAVAAQQARKVYRIGWLTPAPSAQRDPFVEPFIEGLRERGWVEGQDFTIESRGADRKPERFPDLAADLVRVKVDVIVTAGGPASLQAARNATTTVPIVMLAASSDPIGERLIVSFARPGGNVTGMISAPDELGGKRLELLKETLPSLSRVGVLWTSSVRPYGVSKGAEDAARALKVQLLPIEVRSGDDLPGAFKNAVQQRVEAISIVSSPLVFQQRRRIAELALEHRLPTVSTWRYFAEAGGLLTYGPSLPDQFRRAAYYVDRILRGANPADLPVEQPTKFELVMNMKTAKALGLTIPPSLLLRADQMIE